MTMVRMLSRSKPPQMDSSNSQAVNVHQMELPPNGMTTTGTTSVLDPAGDCLTCGHISEANAPFHSRVVAIFGDTHALQVVNALRTRRVANALRKITIGNIGTWTSSLSWFARVLKVAPGPVGILGSESESVGWPRRARASLSGAVREGSGRCRAGARGGAGLLGHPRGFSIWVRRRREGGPVAAGRSWEAFALRGGGGSRAREGPAGSSEAVASETGRWRWRKCESVWAMIPSQWPGSPRAGRSRRGCGRRG